MPTIVLIAAVAEENRVIGRGMELPWHLPEDLKRFKRLTHGHPLLMGRKTFESIVHQFGGPLPGRRHLVLTRSGLDQAYPGVATFASIDDAMASVADAETVYIGGGERVYEQFLDDADRLELTLVEGAYAGDAHFPEWRHLVGPVFEVAGEEPHEGFRFVTYARRRGV